jgi:type II secretory ATPase GspE/PulE/Tfp pilus assembly ATPase PilB-like protein
MRAAITTAGGVDTVRRLARARGMPTLRDDAERLVAAGVTTREEIIRVLS